MRLPWLRTLPAARRRAVEWVGQAVDRRTLRAPRYLSNRVDAESERALEHTHDYWPRASEPGMLARMAEPAGTADLAFVCPMPMELRPLARRLSLRRTCVGDLALRSGWLGTRPVVAIVTGVGTGCARRATRRLLDAVAVEHVVVVGITGAVGDAMPIGALVHPEIVVDGATGVEHRPVRLGEESPRGKMWTTDALHTDLDFIADLRARGVVSLDMETAAVAEVCEGRHVPWSVVRAVSDRATDGSVDEEVFALSNPDGTPNARAVLRYAARHPGRLPAMFRLARGARLATRVAADAAISACSRA